MVLSASLHHCNSKLPPPSPCTLPSLLQRRNACFLRLADRRISSKIAIVSASISDVYSYEGAVDYETRPMLNWKGVCRKICSMENPDMGAGSVLNDCATDGKKFSRWDLFKVIKELRKYRRYRQALEVFEWMSSRDGRYQLSVSNAAIQLDLIAKVRGISAAEKFFQDISSTLKDGRVYGALLNCYVRGRMLEKSEALLEAMRAKGFATQALTFNVIMTLYMKLKQHDKVERMVSEMMSKNVQLDIYSYNIWLSSRGSQGSVDKMEQVFDLMVLDKTINPNWSTFTTMATMYVKIGQIEKAEDSLKKAEGRITGRDRIPYHYLLSLYGTCGNKEEVYRVWSMYKAAFATIPNLGYHSIISSLVRIGDIEGAETMYEDWLQSKPKYDPRIANLLMGFYAKQGNVDKAEKMLRHIGEMGGTPTAQTWEIMAEANLMQRRLVEAIPYLENAFAAADESKGWKLKRGMLSLYLELCEEEGNVDGKEAVLGLCRLAGYLEDEAYTSLIG